MRNQFANSFADDVEEDAEDQKNNQEEPEYSFAGYSIEVNEKIALTPVTPVVKG